MKSTYQRYSPLHEIFPDICGVIDKCLVHKYTYLKHNDLKCVREREVSEIVYALIFFGLIDFSDEWSKYNLLYAKCFIENFLIFNDVMDETSAIDVCPFVIMNIFS